MLASLLRCFVLAAFVFFQFFLRSMVFFLRSLGLCCCRYCCCVVVVIAVIVVVSCCRCCCCCDGAMIICDRAKGFERMTSVHVCDLPGCLLTGVCLHACMHNWLNADSGGGECSAFPMYSPSILSFCWLSGWLAGWQRQRSVYKHHNLSINTTQPSTAPIHASTRCSFVVLMRF